MLHNSSAAMNVALSTLIAYLDAQPILHLTVDDFLWGYDDPLVHLASNMLPNWINFRSFGLLDRVSSSSLTFFFFLIVEYFSSF